MLDVVVIGTFNSTASVFRALQRRCNFTCGHLSRQSEIDDLPFAFGVPADVVFVQISHGDADFVQLADCLRDVFCHAVADLNTFATLRRHVVSELAAAQFRVRSSQIRDAADVRPSGYLCAEALHHSGVNGLRARGLGAESVDVEELGDALDACGVGPLEAQYVRLIIGDFDDLVATLCPNTREYAASQRFARPIPAARIRGWKQRA